MTPRRRYAAALMTPRRRYAAALMTPRRRYAAALARQPVYQVALRARDLFPFTALGVALALGAGLALRAFAYAELDLVWLVTGYAALGLCALCPVFVIATAALLRWRFARAHKLPSPTLALETLTVTPSGFSLPSLWFVPLVQVRWQWLTPSAVTTSQRAEAGRLAEYIAFSERGQHESIVRRIVVEDPFGLSRVAFRLTQARRLRVVPNLGALSTLPTLTSLAAGSDLPHPMGLDDGDRLELVRYTPGDPARFIHWKVFARTGRLMVRKPERAVALAQRCAAFLVAGPSDDATAASARLAIERHLLGHEWVFGTDLAVAGTKREPEAIEAVIESARARAQPAEQQARGLPAFLSEVEKQGPASVIVFAPPAAGAWLEVVTTLARRRQLRVVMAVDGLRSADKVSWLGRVLAFATPTTGSVVDDLEHVFTQLGRAGIALTLLDRTTGRPLGEAQRRALLRSRAGSSAAAVGGASVAEGTR